MHIRGEFITTAQAAEILHYTVAWVNKQAGRGQLPVAHKLPGLTGAYLFRREDIERIAAERTAA